MSRNTDLLDGRYQHQPWYVKIWRRVKYQWNLPWVAFSIWRWEKIKSLSDDHHERMSWRNCWGLANGLSQVKMNWVYDWEEVKDRWFDKPDG